MRLLLGVLSLLILASVSQPASAYEYPWCAHYGGRTGGVNCGFVSWQQCRATVSGVGGHCVENPFYFAQAERPRVKRKRVYQTY